MLTIPSNKTTVSFKDNWLQITFQCIRCWDKSHVRVCLMPALLWVIQTITYIFPIILESLRRHDFFLPWMMETYGVFLAYPESIYPPTCYQERQYYPSPFEPWRSHPNFTLFYAKPPCSSGNISDDKTVVSWDGMMLVNKQSNCFSVNGLLWNVC